MGQVGNLYDSEATMVQGPLGGICSRRRARETRALEVESKVPALTRYTNVPNKRVCPLLPDKLGPQDRSFCP